jgi:hypothetical protein
VRSRTARAGVRQVTALAVGLAFAAVGGAGLAQAQGLPAAAPASHAVAAAAPGAEPAGLSGHHAAAETRIAALNLGGPVGIVAVAGGVGGLVTGLVRRRRKALTRASVDQKR